MTGHSGLHRRRAAVIAITAISLLLLLGFASLAIDVGHAYATKASLQNMADAAALAGMSALISDDALKANYDFEPGILSRVSSFAAQNGSLPGFSDQYGQSTVTVCSDGITIGRIDDPNDVSAQIDTTDPETNAVQVSISFDGECNPKLQTIFASLLGIDAMELNVSAMALYDDRFAGFAPGESGGPLTPFSVKETDYLDQLANPVDTWKWDPTTDTFVAGSDGIPELWIYPDKQNGGNFGTLNIGIGNQGTDALGDQIENGVTEAQMTTEFSTDRVIFVDEGGTYTYTSGGNPGLSSGLKSYVEARIGDTIGFFIHSAVNGTGSNSTYTLKDIKFGRLIEVSLSGNPNKKRIVVQPTVYNGAGLIFDAAAPSSGGLVARLQLIR